MSSSSIERILLALKNNSNDKKDTLSGSYHEKSIWLKAEMDIIRNLIKSNPRDVLSNQQEPELSSLEPVQSSSSSSAAAQEQSGDRKRKSPSTVNEVKASPLPKRSSVNMEDLILQAGLPADLSVFTKEKLMAELKKRGNEDMSKSNLKCALVDALKATLLREHQNQKAPDQNSSSESGADVASAVEADSTSMVLSTPSKPAPIRGSLMSDFRSHVQNSNQGTTTASSGAASAKPLVEGAAAEQKKRIEEEYNARMHRQRESIAVRQSLLVEVAVAPSVAVQVKETPAVKETPTEVAPVVVAPVAVAAPALSLAVPSSVASKDSLGSTGSSGGDSIWMEVSSPVRNSNPQAETAEEESEEESAVVEAPRPRTESDASFQSCASSGSNVPKSTSTTSSTASGSQQGVKSAAATTHSSVRPLASKMAAYNTEKPAVAKSVVPSVMKAKLGGKPVEEVKSAGVLKKKDPLPESTAKPVSKPAVPVQSVRPAAAVASAPAAAPVVAAPAPVVAAPTPVVAVVAPTVVVAAPAPASTSAATAASAETATANAAPAKRGIFGFLSNSKKNITATPTAAPTSGAAPLSNSGLFSPGAQSGSTKAAAPAMVDSIIKSAKMDPPPFSTSTTTSTAPAAVSKAPESTSGKIATSSAPLNNAFTSKSLISNIVNNYNAALNNTPGSAVAAAPVAAPTTVAPVVAAPKPVVTASSASVLRDITSTTNAPASAVKAAPVAVAAPAQQQPVPSTPAPAAQPVALDEYVIEDRDDSDESGTDGEGENEDAKKPKQNVPEWARGPLLKEALERQYGLGGQTPMDPDLIFPEVTTCSLEEIFGAREGLTRKYGNRSSSAHWDADQMTLVEKRVYRKHMGYDRGQAAGAQAK